MYIALDKNTSLDLRNTYFRPCTGLYVQTNLPQPYIVLPIQLLDWIGNLIYLGNQ